MFEVFSQMYGVTTPTLNNESCDMKTKLPSTNYGDVQFEDLGGRLSFNQLATALFVKPPQRQRVCETKKFEAVKDNKVCV